MRIRKQIWDEFWRLVGAADRIALVTHKAPDGDAIGSLLGLGLALKRIGKRVVTACHDPVPDKFRFLPGASEVLQSPDGIAPDLLIALDSSEPARTGRFAGLINSPEIDVLNLDHHPTNTGFGLLNLVDPDASSTSELVMDALEAGSLALDESIATCLLTGIVTDTQAFRTPNVTPSLLLKAGRLMDAGAPLYKIIAGTVASISYIVLRLWSEALRGVRLEDGVIWAVEPLEMRKAIGYEEPGDGHLVHLLLSVAEAKVAAVFRMERAGEVEVSLRARPGYDVASVAREFGGGGHILAAGATVPGSLDEVVARVLPLLKAEARREI